MKKTKFFIAMFVMCAGMSMISCGNSTEVKDASTDSVVVDSDSVVVDSLAADTTATDSVA